MGVLLQLEHLHIFYRKTSPSRLNTKYSNTVQAEAKSMWEEESGFILMLLI